MRTLLVLLVLLALTPLLGGAVILAGLLGVPDRAGSIYDRLPRFWCRAILTAAGVRVVLHNAERARDDRPRVFIANHVSWFDVFTLAAVLRRYKFVGKAELFRIPIFGRAATAAGMIAIERENRKAAFQAFERAALRMGEGASVVVCPEGTRGDDYALRPFKMGPFVLAIAAHAPVVPTLLYGTRHVYPRGSWLVKSGTVHVHFLEEIPTVGLSYDGRSGLSRECWQRMAAVLESEYGIVSDPSFAGRAVRGEEPVRQ